MHVLNPFLFYALFPVSTRVMPSPLRTTSAIDPGAQRRAKARAAYCAALAQPKIVPNYSVRKLALFLIESYIFLKIIFNYCFVLMNSSNNT